MYTYLLLKSVPSSSTPQETASQSSDTNSFSILVRLLESLNPPTNYKRAPPSISLSTKQFHSKSTYFFSFSNRQHSLLNNTNCHTIFLICSVNRYFFCGGWVSFDSFPPGAIDALVLGSPSPCVKRWPSISISSVGCRVGVFESVPWSCFTFSCRRSKPNGTKDTIHTHILLCIRERHLPQATTAFSHSSSALSFPSSVKAFNKPNNSSCLPCNNFVCSGNTVRLINLVMVNLL